MAGGGGGASFQSPHPINSPEPGLKVATPLPGEPMINQLFRTVMLHKGSDLHLKAGLPGMMRLRGVIQNGAIYPDSGYSVRHEYGEWAHWESWTEPYLQWIRTRYAAEGYRSADARRHEHPKDIAPLGSLPWRSSRPADSFSP